jgi:hypothetical protein
MRSMCDSRLESGEATALDKTAFVTPIIKAMTFNPSGMIFLFFMRLLSVKY